MTISEMHVMFRQYAQQMGMQNVRAILPEQIDLLLNTSIMDIVNQTIKENIGITNDRVITDNSKIGQINALRTLYKVKEIEMSPTANPTSETSSTINTYANSPYSVSSKTIFSSENVLYYVDFSIKYDLGDSKESRLFPIRIIDDSYLADVLNDWVLAPRMRTPVMVVYKDDTSDTDSVFDIYIGDNDSISTIASTAKIKSIRCSYIKAPKKVAYLSDVGGTNVDCDLPEQLHIPMLKHAVDLYRISIQGSLYANQQNAQQNQQEIARNNVRPDNEGYQS